jgi:hypothetical protein
MMALDTRQMRLWSFVGTLFAGALGGQVQADPQLDICEARTIKGFAIRTAPDAAAPIIQHIPKGQELLSALTERSDRANATPSPQTPNWQQRYMAVKGGQSLSTGPVWMVQDDIWCPSQSLEVGTACQTTTIKRWDEMPYYRDAGHTYLGQIGPGTPVTIAATLRLNEQTWVQLNSFEVRRVAGWVHRHDVRCEPAQERVREWRE